MHDYYKVYSMFTTEDVNKVAVNEMCGCGNLRRSRPRAPAVRLRPSLLWW